MNPDLSAIRKLVNVLSQDELSELCFDHFKPVHDQFTDGMAKSARVRMLIDHVDRHRQIQNLLNAVETINPIAYAEFNAGLISLSETKPAMETKCDILILSANPRGTDLLQLHQEATLIRQEFEKGTKKYVVKEEQAVRVEDLSHYLLKYEPIILHISGHGGTGGEIILENERLEPQPVSAETLAKLLSVTQGRTECVVLNACFSLERADALIEEIGCVIGMTKEIDDESALRFATGFYRGLAFNKGYYAAFELGRNEILLMGLPDAKIPHFITRDTTLLSPQVAKPRLKRSTGSPVQQTQQTATKYPLWFATNRCPIEPSDASKGFSSERDDQIHYGICQVSVPQSHKIGSTGSSWWQRLLTLTDDRLRLDTMTLNLLTQAVFWADVKKCLQERTTDERAALVYIHGFNVSFEDAALRAAQIGFDLQVPGITAFYSWPSKGKLAGYAADVASIQASELYIAEFLRDIYDKSGAGQIHIIAHSMGNRGLLRSMQRILHEVGTRGKVCFGQILLAAPDEDCDVFKNSADAFRALAQRTTLYLSSKDMALATSGIIHDYPRAGFCPPHTVVSGMDTVEVSNVDLTFLGHGYYASARDVLQDMHDLLVSDLPPNKRFGLKEQLTSAHEKFWVIGA